MDLAMSICAGCRRAADPDTELLVVVLGQQMCSACAADEAEVQAAITDKVAPDGRKIITSHDRPPVPSRAFDWSAVLDDYDGAPDAGFQPVGHGATEDEAVRDLLLSMEDA